MHNSTRKISRTDVARCATAGLMLAAILVTGCRAGSEAKNPRWSMPFRDSGPVPRAIAGNGSTNGLAGRAVEAEERKTASFDSEAPPSFLSHEAATSGQRTARELEADGRSKAPRIAGSTATSPIATVGGTEMRPVGAAIAVGGTDMPVGDMPVGGTETRSSDGNPPVARISVAPPPIGLAGIAGQENIDGMPALTLNEAEQLAVSTNPLISELRSRIDGLRGKKLQATLPPNPTVGVTGSDIFEDGTGGRHGVYFGRQIVRGNKLGLSAATVDAEIQVAQQQLRTAELRLRTDVRLAWFDLLVAVRKQELAQQLMDIARQAVDTSQRLFEAQEVARTAVLQAEMEFQNANVVRGQVAAERTAAERRLATLIGKTGLDDTPLQGDPESAVQQADFEMAFDEILTSSPELAALQMDIERARRNIARQCAEPIPNVTWQATVLYDTVSDNIVTGYQVGLPLPIRNRNQGAVQQARREMDAAAYRAERRALALRQDLASAFEAFTRAKIEADITRDQILPKARETWDLIVEGYAQGEVDFLSLLTAQRTYFDANLNYLNALKQVWREGNRIRGFLLDDGLNSPSP